MGAAPSCFQQISITYLYTISGSLATQGGFAADGVPTEGVLFRMPRAHSLHGVASVLHSREFVV